jgi:photosystem II 13kDa protein
MKLLTVLAAIALPLSSAFAPNPTFTATPARLSTTLDAEATIQFVRGLAEKVVPDIKLTRARDGSSGTATFRFKNPNVFDASTASRGEVTGMFLVDDEGEMSTTDVNANFVNGKPQSLESVYLMKSPEEWDRFMRFMERYGEANGLAFNKAK